MPGIFLRGVPFLSGGSYTTYLDIFRDSDFALAAIPLAMSFAITHRFDRSVLLLSRVGHKCGAVGQPGGGSLWSALQWQA